MSEVDRLGTPYGDRRNPDKQYRFEKTHSIESVNLLISNGHQTVVSTAGRVLSIRDQGGLIFGDLNDLTGSIQIVIPTQSIPDVEDFRKLTIGDWIGVRGELGKTRRGEPSIFVEDWVTLARTAIAFPDKRKGLTNIELQTRQRYLDLACNVPSRERFLRRSKIVSLMRSYLESRDFVEVETPTLQPLYGGANARPFTTHHNVLDMDLYLRIAPELYLKRLVVGGLERVFEIGKVFRNEGISTRHNPEFTMMEAYAAYWDFTDQMNLIEDMVTYIAMRTIGSLEFSYEGRELSLLKPWKRVTLDEVVSNAVHQQVSVTSDISELRKLCRIFGVEYFDDYGSGRILMALFEKMVENTLVGPVFVTDYPKEVSPLARDHRSRDGYTERFEVFVAGRELCNGYSELNQPEEQMKRFVEQEESSGFDDEAMRLDHDYIRALKYGLPPTAGVGIGVDRLTMLLTDTAAIRDTILFPTQRRELFDNNDYSSDSVI